jgi:hypothetical protein
MELPADQQVALQELGKGATITDAALAAGVDRRTVSRWIHHDPNFTAAYNAWCQELLDSGLGRALAMTDSALNTIANAIQNGHVNASLQVVKQLGVLRAAKPGSTDAGQIKRRHAVRKARREKKLREAEVKHGLRSEEKVEKDGIAWTWDAELNLDDEERQMLYFLRERMARRTKDKYAGFSPLDAGRELTKWERDELFKARQELICKCAGGMIVVRGQPSQLHPEFDGPLPRSKRQMFDILVKAGIDKDEALRLLEKYPKPSPDFYAPGDLPYAEDELDPAKAAAPGPAEPAEIKADRAESQNAVPPPAREADLPSTSA